MPHLPNKGLVEIPEGKSFHLDSGVHKDHFPVTTEGPAGSQGALLQVDYCHLTLGIKK